MINLEFDDTKVSEDDATKLSHAVRDIVGELTAIEDVFVYGNASRIKVQIAPIEIWVRMSEEKIKDFDALFNAIKSGLSDWKQKSKFPHPINFTLLPMKWRFEIGI